jgi:hypothetical protein
MHGAKNENENMNKRELQLILTRLYIGSCNSHTRSWVVSMAICMYGGGRGCFGYNGRGLWDRDRIDGVVVDRGSGKCSVEGEEGGGGGSGESV